MAKAKAKTAKKAKVVKANQSSKKASAKKSLSSKKKKTLAKASAASKKSKPVKKTKSAKATQTKSAKTKSAKTKSAKTKAGSVKAIKTKAGVAKSSKTKSSADLSKVLTPLDDRVLVQLQAKEKMTAGGLYIPDTATSVSGNLKAVVVAVGRGHLDKKGKLRPLDVKVGDQVLFAEYVGSKVEISGAEYLFVRESEILGVEV